MRRTKEQKGITLIALIITIVVLLILAVVAINSIQNDGIISHAGNTANTYNQAVKNEQETLQNYLDYLDKANGGSGNGEVEEDEPKTYVAYTIGQEVEVVKDGVEYPFYVIENSDETKEKVLLLAKRTIKSTSGYAFSASNYWASEFTSDPHNLSIPTEQPDSTHYAERAAYDYGIEVGGDGRLMFYSEFMNLKQLGFESLLYECGYWLGSLGSASTVYAVYLETGPHAMSEVSWTDEDGFTSGCSVGYRPVVEISKDLVELVTE